MPNAVRFSSRLPRDLSASPLTEALQRAPFGIDLTESNPTLVGLRHDEALLGAALGTRGLSSYHPEPLGSREAREAVAAYLARAGRRVPIERLALTASTSEAYAVLFKLLGDAGATVAVPAPSYPLVVHLAELELLATRPYQLSYDDGWHIELDALEEVLAGGARIVVAISPNNPTGNVFDGREYERVAEACLRHGAALIIDEVFAPYGADGQTVPSFVRDDGPLTFVLDGLSKSAALPQVKLGWISVFGLEAAAAMVRLEWLLDAYLSVSAMAQLAAPALLAAAPAMQRQINARLAKNRLTLAHELMPPLEAAAGWQAVLRLMGEPDEELLVAHLAKEAGVRVHPGFFYDFAKPGYLVLSLITEPARFAEGARALARGLRDLGCQGSIAVPKPELR